MADTREWVYPSLKLNPEGFHSHRVEVISSGIPTPCAKCGRTTVHWVKAVRAEYREYWEALLQCEECKEMIEVRYVEEEKKVR